MCLAVNDEIDFRLKPGGELPSKRRSARGPRSREAVVIDHVAEDEVYCGHPTPKMYGFRSYVSMPIFLKEAASSARCARSIPSRQAEECGVIGMFKIFAELIAFHLDAGQRLATARANLLDARTTAELREQFIAVLGHDLRDPLASIGAGTELLRKTPLDEGRARSSP